MCKACVIEAQTKNPNKVALSAKANSVLALQNYGYGSYYYKTPTDVMVWPTINDSHEVSHFFKNNVQRMFARPAPLTPVHGFVESREVKNWAEFERLGWEVELTKAKDEILEIILMPLIEAKFSGIITPKSITIGRDNDGATGGKKSVVIRTPKSTLSYILSNDIINKFTKPNEATFVEVVRDEANAHLVQVRSGNEEGDSNDYIPKNVTVKNVVSVDENTDLLQLAKEVKKFGKGTVIHAESLSCHGAVHGVAHKIPVITSHIPVVGEKLEAGNRPPVNFERVKNLLALLINQTEDFDNDKVLYGWKLTHTLAANLQAGGEESIAFALYYMLMGGVSACLGEYRYYEKRSKVFSNFSETVGKPSRTEVFGKAFNKKTEAIKLMFKVWRGFLDDNAWDGSFGGEAWADCTSHTVKLGQVIGKFVTDPTEDNLNSAVSQANELAHCQHNGGLLFNKFGAGQIEAYDIFNKKGVLSTLMDMRDFQAIIAADESFVRVVSRNIPKTIENYEEYQKKLKARKKAAKKKAQEKYEKEHAAEIAAAKAKQAEAAKQAEIEQAQKDAKYTEQLLNNISTGQMQYRFLDANTVRLQMQYLDGLMEKDIEASGLPKAKATKKSFANSNKKYVPLMFDYFELNGEDVLAKCKVGDIPVELKLHVNNNVAENSKEKNTEKYIPLWDEDNGLWDEDNGEETLSAEWFNNV